MKAWSSPQMVMFGACAELTKTGSCTGTPVYNGKFYGLDDGTKVGVITVNGQPVDGTGTPIGGCSG